MDADDLIRPGALGAALAAALGEDGWRELDARLITGGKSNLTFELTSPAGSAVLRRPPTGPLLPRAHDMSREAQVQRALAPTPVPVARILLEQREPGLLAVPFYVMEKLPGLILRDHLPSGFAASDADRVALADALVDTLAVLHSIDPAQVGLAGYGRPGGFMARQVRTWSRQWAAATTHDVPAVDELAERLSAHPWDESRRTVIVHGDYRLDNCLVDAADPARLTGVLDWELSTLGDPLADLGMMLSYWVEEGEPTPVLTPALTAAPGFPNRRQLAGRYAAATGDHADVGPYMAFSHFKFAAIAQGIAARVAAGQMAGQDFGDLDTEVERVAARGLALLRG